MGTAPPGRSGRRAPRCAAVAGARPKALASFKQAQSDYLRKISLKMLSMETKTQQASGYTEVIPNQNNPAQDSADQTGHAGAGDWQEEIYQMIKSLKDQYFAELSELFSKHSLKLQHVESTMPPQKPSEQYKRMKNFKMMLERILQFLHISKSAIQPALRAKVPQYEKQIIGILNSQKRKPVRPRAPQRFQPPSGQAPNSNISRQPQPSQSSQQHGSHANPQAGFFNVSTGFQSSSAAGIQYVHAPPTANFVVPTQQRNGANIQWKEGSNMGAVGGSYFKSWQYGSMGGVLPQGSTGPIQGAMNAQLQTSMLSHNSMSTTQPNANSMQTNATGWTHLPEQRKHVPKRSWSDTL